MIFRRPSFRSTRRFEAKIDVALLVLRLGIGLTFVLLFGLKQSEGAKIFAYHPGRLWPLAALSIGAFLVISGFLTELAAAFSGLSWAWALYGGLRIGLEWYSLPIRSALYTILFTALAITGPGKFSVDYLLRRRATAGSPFGAHSAVGIPNKRNSS